MTENRYQNKLIKKLSAMFPGCMIWRTDPRYQQGILDIVILYHAKWASLEIKASADAYVQPNQRYYVEKLNAMSFAAFIYPENEKEVLSALQQAFEPPRGTCVLES